MSKPMTNYNERLDEILDDLVEGCEDGRNALGYRYDLGSKAKQAIKQLTKKLVAEAKPTNSVTQRGSVTVYGDLGERDLNIINLFEQNLLKALEEV